MVIVVSKNCGVCERVSSMVCERVCCSVYEEGGTLYLAVARRR